MGITDYPRAAFDGTIPLGLCPKWVVEELRRVEILEAMLRYAQSNPPKKFPDAWVTELSQLQFSTRPSENLDHYKAIRPACGAAPA